MTVFSLHREALAAGTKLRVLPDTASESRRNKACRIPALKGNQVAGNRNLGGTVELMLHPKDLMSLWDEDFLFIYMG